MPKYWFSIYKYEKDHIDHRSKWQHEPNCKLVTAKFKLWFMLYNMVSQSFMQIDLSIFNCLVFYCRHRHWIRKRINKGGNDVHDFAKHLAVYSRFVYFWFATNRIWIFPQIFSLKCNVSLCVFNAFVLWFEFIEIILRLIALNWIFF